jgi:hypothetical protein
MLSKAATSASTACASSARAPVRKTSVSGSAKLVSVTMYTPVEKWRASKTPAIRRLTIATQEQLVSEIEAWERQRNASGARIKWMFTTEKARAKMGCAYPKPAAKSGRPERVKSSVTRY